MTALWSSEPRPLTSPLRAAAFGAGVLAFAFFAWRYRFTVMDDPYITFRYAQMLLAGEGLVFNPGERLEGYSNFIWTLISTLPVALGIDPLAFARILSVLLALAVIAVLAFGVPRLKEDLAAPFGAVLLGAAYPFAVWSMGGLETIQYTTCVFAALIACSVAASRGTPGSGIVAGFLLALVALSRPEGAMVAAVPVVLLPFAKGCRRALLISLAVFAVIFALYNVWRLIYFGTLIPNTVTAKVGGSTASAIGAGLKYVAEWLLAPALLLVVAACAQAVSAFRRLRSSHSEAPSLPALLSIAAFVFCALQGIFTIAVGGDWMPGMRFLVPLLPPLCWLAGRALQRIPLPAGAAVVVLVAVSQPFVATGEEIQGLRALEWTRVNANGRTSVAVLEDIGRDLAEEAEPGARVALTEAGAVPYFSGLPIIDMFGLVDAQIAEMRRGLHQNFDAGSVLAREPEYILLGTIPGEEGPIGVWAPDQDMLSREEFRREYEEARRWERQMPTMQGTEALTGHMILYRRTEAR